MWVVLNRNELYHHGIKGMRWGLRRYQNPDGSLTPEGLARYKKKAELREWRLKERQKALKKELKNKKKERRKEMFPAVAGVAAGAAIVGASVIFASHADEIGYAIFKAGAKTIDGVGIGMINAGKKSAKLAGKTVFGIYLGF